MKIKEAIILAGGLGTRLRSTVPDLPKCMAPVAGEPFLFYVIDYYLSHGIEKFIFSLGYMHEHIESFLRKKLTSLQYESVIEDEPLGTGGAIKFACTKASCKNVLTLNGDTFFKIDVHALAQFHHDSKSDCTLALKPMKDFNRYGVVELNADSSINSFHEKKEYKQGLINGGVYCLNVDSFISENLPRKFSFEKDYLESPYPGRRMFGCVQDKYFIDIGIPEDFTRAQTELPANL
jgi:D-glycero-alpha-D-manno-heptose 1-phosphate guanylyltransferase